MRYLRTLLLLVTPAIAGCAMCCGVDDYNYSAYGGKWQRSDMSQGRVGSIFAEFAEFGESEGIPVEPAEPEILPAPQGIASPEGIALPEE